MTVTYNLDVGNASIKSFLKLLWRWKGSVWKAVYLELLVWISAYASLALIYYLLMNEEQQSIFEAVCVFFAKYADFVPVTFMLGFFVSVVVSRWWSMFENLGWIDIPALYICHHVEGSDDNGRLIRRNLIRHLLFFQILVFRDISLCIRERFPTLESCIQAGYLTKNELEVFERQNSRYPQYWMPVNWVMAGLMRAYKKNYIATPKQLEDIQRRVMDFRNNLGTLLGYDWVPLPLLYAQVVSLSVRLYFLIAVLGRQNLLKAVEHKYIDPINLYVPIMSICQFVFYIGWLKVAEALLNPFGGDDDDFEINWLIDRNLEVGYMIVEDREAMSLEKDAFWHESDINPFYSEYTVDATCNPQQGSAAGCKPRHDSVLMVPRIKEDEKEEKDLDRSASILGSFQRHLSHMRNSIFPDSDPTDSSSSQRIANCDGRIEEGERVARDTRDTRDTRHETHHNDSFTRCDQ